MDGESNFARTPEFTVVRLFPRRDTIVVGLNSLARISPDLTVDLVNVNSAKREVPI
jgi:hypothetical protein